MTPRQRLEAETLRLSQTLLAQVRAMKTPDDDIITTARQVNATTAETAGVRYSLPKESGPWVYQNELVLRATTARGAGLTRIEYLIRTHRNGPQTQLEPYKYRDSEPVAVCLMPKTAPLDALLTGKVQEAARQLIPVFYALEVRPFQ
jgi:hypothetical protein